MAVRPVDRGVRWRAPRPALRGFTPALPTSLLTTRQSGGQFYFILFFFRGTILKRKWHCISPPLRDLFCGLQVPSKWNPNSLPRPQTAARAYKCSIYKAVTHAIHSQSCVRARKARSSIRGQFPGLKVLFLYLSHTRKVPQCASKVPSSSSPSGAACAQPVLSLPRSGGAGSKQRLRIPWDEPRGLQARLLP